MVRFETVLLFLLLGPGFPDSQDPGRERALARAEARFNTALEKREDTYAKLVEEYRRCEAWLAGKASSPAPPLALQALFEKTLVQPEGYQAERIRLQDAGPFFELWNKELYRLSPAARNFAKAADALEKSFLALEKLRHPQRFNRALEKTPEGMALVPGGKISLGPATGYILEQPAVQKERTVRLHAFYLDKREVSNAEYAKFLLAQPPSLRDENLPLGWGRSSEGSPLFPDGKAEAPVTGITWVSAARYAAWAGKRLPSEEEWEAAASGLEHRRYPMGNRFSAFKVNCRAYGAGEPLPPGRFPEDNTPLGILSMTGNVREWTASGLDGKPVRHPGPSTLACVRGGSFQDDPDFCTSTFRWLYPALDSRLSFVGFRCALDVR
ncbi:MAG: formylglycine-generating enzyme family protein [Planctomycetota bacterium]